MASLKFIMDMDVDDDPSDPHPSSRSNKDQEPPAPSAQLHRGQGPSSGSIPLGHVPTAAAADHYADDSSHLSAAAAPATATSSSASGSASGKRRAALGRAAKSSSSSTAASSSTPLSSAQAPEARRRSTASVDSLDQTGYMSSSSMGGGGGGPPNHPIRPMRPNQPGSDLPLKLTPITGRVSRAKKGVPVHTCDVCKPPKTFTRAEHLRRHQLSHQTPAFACTHPGCDRQFHRADLLARHQQKHDQEPIRFDAAAVPPRGGGQARRDSSQSLVDGASRMGLQHPGGPPSAGPGSSSGTLGAGASTPASASDVPPTPTLNSTTPGQQRGGGGGPGSHASMSPGMGGGGGSRNYSTSGGRYGGGDYVTDSHQQTSIIYPSGVTTPVSAGAGHFGSDFEPRTPGNLHLYVVTQGLSDTHHLDSNPPDLHVDMSPWASSTDSSYSTTPAVDHIRNRRYGPSSAAWVPRGSSPSFDWPNGPSSLIFPNPTAAGVRDAVALDAVATPYFYSTIHPSPQVMPPHSQAGAHGGYGGFLDVPMQGGYGAEPTHHALMAGVDHRHHHAGAAASSVRSPSPIAATTVSAESLVTPSTALPTDRLSMLATLSRQKEVVMEGGSVGMYASMPFGGASGSPGAMLAGGVGCGGGGGHGGGVGLVLGALPTPLNNAVRRAIPGYIDVYWARFHHHFPIIHRPSFEAGGGEEVLRCAMAAVATQLLDGKEDRNRGNLLHEFAWHEAKRCPQWNLQVMQAILICEFFARFRGRKAAIKPSKLFDHLYSRVSTSGFFASPDDGVFYAGGYPPASSFGPSSRSSSVSSNAPFSWSSAFATTPTTSSSSLQAAFGATNSNAIATTTATATATAAATAAAHDFNSLSMLSSPSSIFALQPSLLPRAGHQYLNTSQVLDCDSNPVFPPEANEGGAAGPASAADVPAEQRWRAWVDAESRRRLLAGCFLLDVHTSLYHEQGRVRHFDLSDGRPPPICLTGPGADLWDARTADDFALVLASSGPAAAGPTLLPPCEALTADAARSYSVFDRKLILAAAAARLPRRQHSQQHQHQQQHQQHASPLSASGTPHPDMPPRSGPDQQHHGQQHPHPAEAVIARVFPDSPVANTYLALHHTPLLDLLAVSGDSWVFTHKVLPEGSFLEHKKRLKAWAASSAGRAATYAARALCAFLSSPPSSSASASSHQGGGGGGDLSEYWAVYVCTLICWAFGHRAVKGGEAAARGLGGEDEVLGWLRVVADMGDDDWARVRGRREAVGVVGVVRRRLEGECLGSKSRLFVDTVGVLKKLEEGITWRWF